MMVAESNQPLLIFQTLVDEQGLKKSWVAKQAGLTVMAMGKRFRRKQGYSWQPGEREAVAKALRVPMSVIWGNNDEQGE